ncbi:MAG: lysophospholipid acyltransferase family protein [Acidobacteriota bacterium]
MSDPSSWRHSRSKRAQAVAIPAVLWPVIEFLGGTYHWKFVGKEYLDKLDAAQQPYILAIWHGRILTTMLAWRDRGLVSLISENFDGEWIARLSAHFGFGAVRGSSSRGGARVLIQAKRQLETGRSLLITPDGPRGPLHVAQPGAVWLASATGCPILPVRVTASRFRTTRSWDRHLVPSPGATVTVVIGAPIEVATNADAASLEAKRLELENVLNAPVRV